jgi:hypothetical protein
MIYLIFVFHEIQFWDETSYKKYKRKDIGEFSSYLKEVVKKYSIALIGEEFNDDAMRKYSATHCTAKDIADNLKIIHKWCDPNTQERGGRKGSELCRFKEDWWVKQIADMADQPIIFICGQKHLKSFPKVIEAAGLKAEILSNGWGKGLELRVNCEMEI